MVYVLRTDKRKYLKPVYGSGMGNKTKRMIAFKGGNVVGDLFRGSYNSLKSQGKNIIKGLIDKGINWGISKIPSLVDAVENKVNNLNIGDFIKNKSMSFLDNSRKPLKNLVGNGYVVKDKRNMKGKGIGYLRNPKFNL